MSGTNSSVPPGIARATSIKAVVFDWAGTTVDFGSLAPVRTLQRVFEQAGCPVTEAEARLSMGLPKRDHIQSLLRAPEVATRWQKVHGTAPNERDVELLYEHFVPLQFDCLAEYAAVIPGVTMITAKLRERGISIGSTTGYTRAMLDVLLEHSRRSGYEPDVSFSPEDVGSGRPHPFMMYEAAVQLKVYPMASIVKVGDTPADIAEGLNAGAWTVGVVETGNMVGLSLAELNALPKSERDARVAAGKAALVAAGAHYVINSVAELESVLNEIEERLMAANGVAR